jgi:hypothetical protein
MAKINLDSILSENKDLGSANIVESKPLPDFDAIVTEWSYRCEKGYPDMNNQSDLLALQTLLEEMGIENPLPKIQITEAPATKKKESATTDISAYPKSLVTKLTKAGKLEKFYEFVKSIPGGDAPDKVSDGISRICVNKGSEDSLVTLFKSGTSLKALTKINPEDGVNKMLFNVRPSGTGPGEVLIAWSIDGAAFQGGTVSYDIDFKGQHWEVKSLIDPDGNAPRSIDPAKYGKMSNFKFTRKVISR